MDLSLISNISATTPFTETTSFATPSLSGLALIKDVGIVTQLAIPTGIITFILLPIGTFGNICMLWAVYRKKALRTPCNYIVALEALVGIGHQWSHVFLAYYIFSGINVVPFRTCFFMMIVSFICAKLSYCLFIVLAIDRLYIILWPSKYRTMNKGLYIFTLVFFANIFGVSMAIMSYIEMEPNYNSPVICYLPSVTGPTASRFTYIFQNSICGIGVALNVFFWLIMRFKRVISDKEAIKKVTRTITVYCALVLIFFQSASLVIMSMQYIVLPPVEKNVISLYAAIFINMLVCSNYFVYFAMSVDFRNEFKRQLYCIAAVMPGIKNVVPSPPTSIIKVTATRKTTVMF